MRRAPWAFTFAVLVATACSSPLRTDSPTPVTDAGVSTEAQAPCGPPPGQVPTEGTYCVRDVTGIVRDLDGRPLPDLTVTVCGLACFAALSRPDGTFRIPVNARLPDGGYAVSAHARPAFGGLYARLPNAPGELVALSPLELPRLSDPTSELPKDAAPASTVNVGPLSFGVAADTRWELELEDLVDEVGGRQLRFASVPEARAPAFARGALAVYALAPFKAKPSKPLSVVVRETGGLAPGAAVDFVVMGDDVVSEKHTGGLPVRVAKGHVSTDGKRIETDPGQGIDRLTWLAIFASR